MALIVQKFGGSSVANAERVFNVADIYVTVAAFAMIILGLFYYKEEDYNKIFHD
mgnify:CR=1 FL=1